MTALVIIGAGGHARVLVEALKSRRSDILGFVSADAETASGIMTGIPRIGDDRDLRARGPADILLVNGIGSVGNPDRRRAIFEGFSSAGFAFATVIHPSAVVASDVVIGAGTQIMAGCVLQPGVRIGANVIINTGAIIDHDTVIGDHVHIAPGARLSGDVKIGNLVHVGTGATIIEGIRIGDTALVAAGAVVTADVPTSARVMGVPARVRSPH
jgi:sugar O-acyltransferase (sialic acid O-acetyltransferase NeuD family)